MRATQKIVDSNALQSPLLRDYLSKSSDNFAVLTDYAAMEAYKGNTLASIFPSMAVLADFPKQVIVLKTTGVVCGLTGRPAGLRRRMVDERQTNGFRLYSRHLRAGELGDIATREQLLYLGRAADVQMERMLTDATLMPEAVEAITKIFTEAELKIIRTSLPIPGQTVLPFPGHLARKVLESIVNITRLLYSRHPRPTVVRSAHELPNTFLFRTALCEVVWALDWISVGGPKDVKIEKIRNDLVDMNFATYATYFDGLLSRDKKLAEFIAGRRLSWGRLSIEPDLSR